MIKLCAVIPVYNHEHAVGHVVNALLAHGIPCILVDDGSNTACMHALEQLAANAHDRITLLRHSHNFGKGRAVLTGFQHAFAAGYSHALQIDADGQHNTADIQHFINLATEDSTAVITGYPQYDASVPKLRLYARYLTHVWVWINTLSFAIKDSMCGFRVYPLAPVMALSREYNFGNRMDFDSNILVRLYWAGLKIVNVPTKVCYPIDGISHFKVVRDNVLISRMHAVLFVGMLRRLPRLMARKVIKRHWAHANEVTFIAGTRLLFWVFRYLGRWPFRIMLYPVVLSYMITQPTARAASQQYLQRIHTLDKGIKIKIGIKGVLRHFTAFAESILDKLCVWSGLSKLDDAKCYGREPLINYIAERRGGILICSHYGNLEFCRALAKKRDGLKLTILVHTKHAQAFNRLIAQLDPSSQLNLMQVTEISAATAMVLREKVAQGEWVVITGDRIPVAESPRVTFAPFLGKNAPFPIGPYVLAHLLQCPVFLLFTMRTKKGMELHFEPFRESIHLSRANRDHLLAELVADYAKRLEYFCLWEPLQWFNFYDFWHFPNTAKNNERHYL